MGSVIAWDVDVYEDGASAGVSDGRQGEPDLGPALSRPRKQVDEV